MTSLTPCTDRRWASPTWPLTSACEDHLLLHRPPFCLPPPTSVLLTGAHVLPKTHAPTSPFSQSVDQSITHSEVWDYATGLLVECILSMNHKKITLWWGDQSESRIIIGDHWVSIGQYLNQISLTLPPMMLPLLCICLCINWYRFRRLITLSVRESVGPHLYLKSHYIATFKTGIQLCADVCDSNGWTTSKTSAVIVQIEITAHTLARLPFGSVQIDKKSDGGRCVRIEKREFQT